MIINRTILAKIERNLDSSDILLLIGARQVGKTTILRQIQEKLDADGKNTYFLNLEDPDIRKTLDTSPKNLFQIIPIGDSERSFVFVDEIQYLADPSNFLKYVRDEHGGAIKLIVSGSSAFYLDEKFHDSLAGRKKIFPIRSLSFREVLAFYEKKGLAEKPWDHLTITEIDAARQRYHEYLLYGGYPRVVLAPLNEKRAMLEELAYSYIKKDIGEAGIRQDEVFYRLFKILASGIGTLVNASELASTLDVSKTLVDRCLAVMQKSFHLQLIKPLFRNMRKELTKMPKAYFLDLGLRNFFAGNFHGYAERTDRGMLLENGCFRQLLETSNEEDLRFWRTTAGQELDFVVGEHRAIEVKANPLEARDRHFRVFAAHYPQSSFEIATFGDHPPMLGIYPVREVWELAG